MQIILRETPFNRRRIAALCMSVCAFGMTGCERIVGSVYKEVGHVQGGAALWKSHSTCSVETLSEIAAVAAKDLPDIDQFSFRSGSTLSFNQNWRVASDPEDKFGRSNLFDLSFASDGSTTLVRVYVEATKQSAANVESTSFDDAHKEHMMQFMVKFFSGASECGLNTRAEFKFG